MNFFGINVGTACPRTAERIVIVIKAEKAAEKTSIRSCFIAIRAAMRNVLSPTSENRIMVRERTKEWKGCIRPSVSSSGRSYLGEDFEFGFVMSRWSFWADSGRGWGTLLGLSGRFSGFCQAVLAMSSAKAQGMLYLKPCQTIGVLIIHIHFLRFGLLALGFLTHG